MNCQKGDLVRYVGNVSLNYGRFVRVIAASPSGPCGMFPGEPMWTTEPRMYLPSGLFASRVADRLLRPIRPDGITDEEVRDLYAPKQTEAA
jgi:hypothetical protein